MPVFEANISCSACWSLKPPKRRKSQKRYLEFEPGGGNAMDVFGQETFDQTTGGFHRFAGAGHQGMPRRFERSFGVGLA